MLTRLLQLPTDRSFFLFGARNTGKSTLIKGYFKNTPHLWIDLLDPEQEDRFLRNPNDLIALVNGLPAYSHVIIDEVQKIPKLLNVVHGLIEKTNMYFVMTGSSARKLKRGAANLLAGRAFVFHLFPFSFLELGEQFQLADALQWGLLPTITQFNTNEDKLRFLQAYAFTYLKEEIWGEQIVKKLEAFRSFLEVAAQCNGKIINYANLARDVGVNDKTIKEYFQILEDTLIGFFLAPFHNSFRKRLSLKAKFYFFDTGVTRALKRMLTVPLQAGTSAYGEAFEHFIILECKKLASYYKPEFAFYYLQTKDHAEIDLVVERPGMPTLLIEIKSSATVAAEDLRTFAQLSKDFGNCEAVCFSNDKHIKQFEHVTVIPWQQGIKQFFVQ